MSWSNESEIAGNFWSQVFSQLGSFQMVDSPRSVEAIFRIPIEEAIMLSRLMPPRSHLFITETPSAIVYLPATEEGEQVSLPEPLGMLVLDHMDSNGSERRHLVSPLLGPSMRSLVDRFPAFFKDETKYLVILETPHFRTTDDAAEAVQHLGKRGIPKSQVVLLTIGSNWKAHATTASASIWHTSQSHC